MASYSATVCSDRAPDEVFDYLADFRSVQDWDPSIIESTHVNADEPIQVGSIFSVTTKTVAKEIVLEYKITELIIHGDADRVASPSRSLQLAARLPTRTSVVHVTVRDGKHAMLSRRSAFDGLASRCVAWELFGETHGPIVARIAEGESQLTV